MALIIGLSEESFLIPSGQSVSAAVPIGAQRVVGLIMPAAWTAAALTFLCTADGTNFFNFYDSAGNEIVVTVDASRYVALTEDMWSSVNFLKIRSGTSAAAVAQAADRTIQLVVRDFR